MRLATKTEERTEPHLRLLHHEYSDTAPPQNCTARGMVNPLFEQPGVKPGSTREPMNAASAARSEAPPRVYLYAGR
jgi:hypothetical protein